MQSVTQQKSAADDNDYLQRQRDSPTQEDKLGQRSELCISLGHHRLFKMNTNVRGHLWCVSGDGFDGGSDRLIRFHSCSCWTEPVLKRHTDSSSVGTRVNNPNAAQCHQFPK